MRKFVRIPNIFAWETLTNAWADVVGHPMAPDNAKDTFLTMWMWPHGEVTTTRHDKGNYVRIAWEWCNGTLSAIVENLPEGDVPSPIKE
jgi:hypothetical protein